MAAVTSCENALVYNEGKAFLLNGCNILMQEITFQKL